MKTPDHLTHPLCLALWLLLSMLSAQVHATDWLTVSGNHIANPDGSVWIGRGANLHDTRSCGGGTAVNGTPLNDSVVGVNEVKRRIDVLTDQWKASFIRLALESRRPQDNYVADANYRSKVKDIVDHIGTKPGVYVLISIWLDPSLDANGWPTAATNTILAQLAQDFYSYPYVLYGVSNEPQSNFDGAQDAQVWTRMNDAVAAIRAAESALGPNRHIVTVQGTRAWARNLSYYVANPITAGGGVNVAYETHIYNSPADFASLLLVSPTRTIPVILGEFGPINDQWNQATVSDMQTLMDMAKANNIPHLAWTFHQYCPPNLIANTPGVAWNTNSTTPNWIGMPMYPTDFGQLLINNLLPAAPTLLNTSFNYNVTSTEDNVTRPATAQVTRLNNFGAGKRPVVVLMPGWGGSGDVAAVRDAQANLFANQGYVALNIGFHQTTAGMWYSDLPESAKAALDALCVQTYADCSAVVLTGQSYGGTQTHPVLRYLRATGTFDGSGGTNAGRKVVAILGQDSGYTRYWNAPIDADASAYSIALIENLGDGTFPVDLCTYGNCGARNRADYHQSAAGSQYVLSNCPAGGSHGSRGYANWDAWVLSAVKTMLHNHRGIAKFNGYVEPSIAVSNACLTTPVSAPGAPTIGTATAGNAQVSVTFSGPASDGGSPITAYTATCGNQSASGPASPIVVAGLAAGVAVTCTVIATNAAGDSVPSAPSNSVTPANVPTAVTLAANPSTVSSGGSATLTWSSNGAICMASGAWSGLKASSGSQVLNNLSSTGNYTLKCSGVGSSASETVTISVSG